MNRLQLCGNSDPFTLTNCPNDTLIQLNDPLCAIGDLVEKLDHYEPKHTPTNDALKKRYLTHIRVNCHSFKELKIGPTGRV